MIRPNDKMPHNIQNDDNTHRIKRARSWVARSEKVKNREEKFICLWIAFNAAYGGEPTDRNEDGPVETEKEKFADFLEDIIERDERNEIEKILWKTFRGSIRILLDNQCVFKPFWQWVRGAMELDKWQMKFRERNDKAKKALGNGDVHGVFGEVFMRLYQLRNQVFHGGVTFKTGYGRSQLEDGVRIMEKIVPVILDIMEAEIDKNPDTIIWGKIAYPRIGDEPWSGDGGC